MNTLLEYRDWVRKQTEGKQMRIARLEHRINTLFYQMTTYANRLQLDGAPPEVRELAITKYHKKIHITQQRRQAISRSLSNQELAKLLRMPKGTVDSGLFLLKQMVANYLTTIMKTDYRELLGNQAILLEKVQRKQAERPPPQGRNKTSRENPI